VGVIQQEHTEEQVNEFLAELAFLAETAGAIAIKVFKQRLPHPDSKTFVGKGKLEEIMISSNLPLPTNVLLSGCGSLCLKTLIAIAPAVSAKKANSAKNSLTCSSVCSC